MRREAGAFLLEIGELLFELAEPLRRGFVPFLAQRFALDLELHDAAFDLVELGRHRVDFHPKLRSGLVNQVDRLVGEEPIGDVAVRQDGRRHQRRILELHAVMSFVALAKPAQDADRVLDGRLAYEHRLEAALEGGVLLDVLPVFVEGRRAHGVQLAAREHRLQHVGCIHRPFGGTRAHHRVELVDEQDDLALRVGDFLQDRLQPLFELATVLRAGDERSHVEGDDALALQALRDVAAHDAPGEAFDNRCLADAGLADEHRVVLRATRQHLNHASYFLVAADHRIELAPPRQLGEVAAVSFERLIRALWILARHALRSTHAGERREDLVAGDATFRQQSGGGGSARLGCDGQQKVLGADVLVSQTLRLCLREVGDGLEPGRQAGLRAAECLRNLREKLAHGPGDLGRVGRHLAQDFRDDALGLLDERGEQVFGLQLRMAHLLGQPLGGHDRFLCFFRVLVDVHVNSSQLSPLGVGFLSCHSADVARSAQNGAR